MSPRIARRSLLGAGMALPLLGLAARAAESSGVLRLGLSSYPPNLTPWINAGSAAGTVVSLMHRGLLSFDGDGRLQGEIAERWPGPRHHSDGGSGADAPAGHPGSASRRKR